MLLLYQSSGIVYPIIFSSFGSLVILDVARCLFVVIHVIYKYKNR